VPTLEESDQNSPKTQTKPFRTNSSFTQGYVSFSELTSVGLSSVTVQ
jgi:hypothetical protein